MSGPIVFISRNRVKAGQLEAFGEYYRDMVEEIKQAKPGTLAHLSYASEDGSMVTIVHIFPDAEAMDRHLQGVGERARKAYDFVESAGLEVYGSPSEGVLRAMQQIAGAGVPLTIWPGAIGGYLRLKPG